MIKIAVAKFSEALKNALKFAANDGTNLERVLLDFSRETPRVATANYFARFQTPFDAERFADLPEEKKEYFVAKNISKIVDSSGENELNATFVGDGFVSRIMFDGEKTRFGIGTSSDGKIPGKFPVGGEPAATFDANEFADAVKKVAFCVDENSGRYALSSVVFEVGEEKTSVVATDGRRLSFVEIDGKLDDGRESFATKIDAKTAVKIVETARSCDSIRVFPFGLETAFAFGESAVVASPIEGTYPKWRKIVPDASEANEFSGDAESLKNAFSAATSALEKGGPVSAKFLFSEEGCEISCKGVAGVVKSLVAGNLDFESTVLFQASFVADFLRRVPNDGKISIFSNGKKPATFVGERWKYVLMPLEKE